MKPIKKRTAKWFISLIVIAAVIGTLFAFVPMNFGGYSFTSLLGSINKSTDLGAGVYAEYDLSDTYSANQISSSISTIKDVLASNGYPGASIFSVNNEKIRIEIGYPKEGSSLKNSYTLLTAVGVGSFELRSSSSEDDTFIVGKDHIKSVKLNTYNDSIYVVLTFNKAGEEQYAKLLEASSTIYVCMGGEVMTSFSGPSEASSTMPLSFTDYDSAKDFAMKVKLGSMPVTLNSKTVVIDTMSTALSAGNASSNPLAKGFNFSVTNLIGILAILLVIVLGLIYICVKYGIMGLFTAVALLFDAIIAVALVSAFTWVEISLSTLIAIGLGFAILLTSALTFASRFEDEFNQGKTIGASFETGYKRSVASILSSGIALTVIFMVLAIVATGELKVFGLITCIFSALSMFSSLIMIPGFMNIFETFNDGAIKPYRLKEREGENND